MPTLQDALLENVGRALAGLSDDVDGRLERLSQEAGQRAQLHEERLVLVKETLDRFVAEIDRVRADATAMRESARSGLEAFAARISDGMGERAEAFETELRADVEAQSDLLAETTKDVVALEGHLAAYEERMIEVAAAVTSANEQLRDLREHLDEEPDNVDARIEAVRAEVLRVAGESRNELHNLLDSAREASRAAVESLEGLVAGNLDRTAALEEGLTEVDGGRVALEQKVAAQKKTFEETEERLIDAVAAVRERTEADVQDLARRVGKLQAADTDLGAQHTSLRAAVDAAREAQISLRADLQGLTELQRKDDEAQSEALVRYREQLQEVDIRLGSLDVLHKDLEGIAERLEETRTEHLDAEIAVENRLRETVEHVGTRIDNLAASILEAYGTVEEWARGGPAYKPQAFVKYRGGLWQSFRKTSSEPGANEDWLLLVNGVARPIVRYDESGDLELGIEFTNGDIASGTLSLPEGEDCGTFEAGRVYKPGDLFRKNGNSYRVQRAGTIDDPDASPLCVIMALRGGRGARGKQGERGPMGPAMPVERLLDALEERQARREGIPFRDYRGLWEMDVRYERGDVVTTVTGAWIAVEGNSGIIAPLDPTNENWAPILLSEKVGGRGGGGSATVGFTLRGSDTWANISAIVDAEIGDAWILTEATGAPTRADGSPAQVNDWVVWTGNNWENVGPIQGPQGEKGDKGDPGDPGPQGEKGDPGPSTPSADAGNRLTVGTDSFLYSPPAEDPIGPKNSAFNKNFAGDGAADTVARSDHAHEGVYLKNVVDDSDPYVGGDLKVGGTDGYVVAFTDTLNTEKGSAGWTDADYTGVFLAHTPQGDFDPNDGAVLFGPGIAEVFGSAIRLNGLQHANQIGYQQVNVTQDGTLFGMPPPDPGWSVVDTSTHTEQLPTLALWVEVLGLEVQPLADVAAGDRLDFSVLLEVRNDSGTRSGEIGIGFGINGAPPTSGGVTAPVGPGFNGTIPVAFSTTTHGGLTSADTLTVWARRHSQSHAQFDPWLDGSGATPHELIVSVPGGGGGGGGPTNLDTVYGPSSVVVTSSTGTNATILAAAADGDAGVLSGADKSKLDDIAAGAQVNHVVQDEGVGLTARANLNFIGAGVTATDDAGNDATTITIPGGVPADATLDGYVETEDLTLASSAGTLTVPLDGRPRESTLTENTTMAATPPGAGIAGSCDIVLIQAATAYTLAYPAGWLWPDGTPATMPTGDGDKLYLSLIEINGTVYARGQVMS